MNTRASEALTDWLLGGDTGSSSKCMAAHLTGRLGDGWCSHPSDPDDFGRCLRLLRAVPMLRARLPQMAAVSPYWAALVPHWDEVEASMLAEVGIAWEKARVAPKTYALMQTILRPVYKADPNVVVIDSETAAKCLATLRKKPKRETQDE